MTRDIYPDDDTELLFEETSVVLQEWFHYSKELSSVYSLRYYLLFTSELYCNRMQIAVQDIDFFHHEGPIGLALRI